MSSKSEGIYRVQHIKVHWQPFQSSLTISELRLTCDSAKWKAASRERSMSLPDADLSIQRLSLKSVSLWKLYRTRQLKVKHVRLESPYLNVRRWPRDTGLLPSIHGVDTLQQVRSRPLLPSFMKLLEIQRLQISKGSLATPGLPGTPPGPQFIEQFDFNIQNLKLDSTDHQLPLDSWLEQPLEVSIELERLPLALSPSGTPLQLAGLHYRSAPRRLLLQGLVVGREPPPRQHGTQLSVPLISLRGIAPRDLLQPRSWLLHSLHLVRPVLKQWGPSLPAGSLSSPFPLPFPDSLGQLHLDSLLIEEGSYQAFAAAQPDSLDVEASAINLQLTDLALKREAAISQLTRALSQRGKLWVGPARLRLPDRRGQLRLAEARVVADSGLIQLQGVKAQRSATDGRTSTFSLPSCRLEGVQWTELHQQRHLLASRLTLDRPEGQWALPAMQFRAQSDSASFPSLASALKPWLNYVSIGRVNLRGGRVQVKGHRFSPKLDAEQVLNAHQLDLNVRRFRLAPYPLQADGRLFDAASFSLDVEVDQCSFLLPDSLHALQSQAIRFRSRDSTLLLDSLLVYPAWPDGQDEGLAVGVPRLRVKGLDLHSALFQRRLQLDSLRLDSAQVALPDLQASSQQPPQLDWGREVALFPLISPYFRSLEVQHLSLEGAQVLPFSFRQTQSPPADVSLYLTGFRLDSLAQAGPSRLLFSDEVQVRLQRLRHVLPDGLHALNIQAVTYASRDRELRVDSLSVQHVEPTAEGDSLAYDVVIPAATLTAFDPLQLYYEQVFEVEAIQVQDPDIHLVQPSERVQQGIDSLYRANLFASVAPYLRKVEAQRIVLKGGKLWFLPSMATAEQPFEADQLYLLVKGFRMDSTSWQEDDKLFYAEDIDLGLDAGGYSLVLPDSSYRLSMGRVGLSTGDKRLFAENLSLEPYAPHAFAEADRMWEVRIPRVHLSGLNLKTWYFDQSLHLREVRVQRPRVRMRTLKPQAERQHEPQQVYHFFARYFKQFQMDDLLISQASFAEIPHPADSLRRPFRVEKLSLRALEVQPNSGDFLQADNLLYSPDVRISLEDYRYPFPEINYELALDNVSLHTASQQVYARGVQFVPIQSQEAFFEEHGFARDHLEITVPDLKVEQLDIDALIQRQDIRARHLLLQDLTIDALKDKHYPQKPDKRPPMPQEVIRDLPLLLHLDTVTVAKGAVHFRQRVPGLKKDARFDVTSIYGAFTRLSNDSSLLAQGLTTRLQAQAQLMKEGELSILYTFPMADTSNAYEFEGRVSSMDLAAFNPLLEQTAFVYVTEGQLDKASFVIRGGYRSQKKHPPYTYRGKLRMHYRDLKLAIIDKKSMFEEGEYDEKKMASFFANTFVRRNNPRSRSRFLRVGKVYYQLEPWRGIAGHWVQAMITGIRSSVGLENKDERILLFERFGRPAEALDVPIAPGDTTELSKKNR